MLKRVMRPLGKGSAMKRQFFAMSLMPFVVSTILVAQGWAVECYFLWFEPDYALEDGKLKLDADQQRNLRGAILCCIQDDGTFYVLDPRSDDLLGEIPSAEVQRQVLERAVAEAIGAASGGMPQRQPASDRIDEAIESTIRERLGEFLEESLAETIENVLEDVGKDAVEELIQRARVEPGEKPGDDSKDTRAV